ncbi:MAG TPA: hypothetical protein VMR34_03030 [Candidatus Saccharimonadales bacterium]|nr:hypothetical protein [Candidatus Saccharimonadales bacterium]
MTSPTPSNKAPIGIFFLGPGEAAAGMGPDGGNGVDGSDGIELTSPGPVKLPSGLGLGSGPGTLSPPILLSVLESDTVGEDSRLVTGEVSAGMSFEDEVVGWLSNEGVLSEASPSREGALSTGSDDGEVKLPDDEGVV